MFDSNLDNTDLNEYFPAVLKLIEWIALNSKQMAQEEKSILFNFCQMPIDRIVTVKGKQDLLIEMMKSELIFNSNYVIHSLMFLFSFRLIDSSSSLYNPS